MNLKNQVKENKAIKNVYIFIQVTVVLVRFCRNNIYSKTITSVYSLFFQVPKYENNFLPFLPPLQNNRDHINVNTALK